MTDFMLQLTHVAHHFRHFFQLKVQGKRLFKGLFRNPVNKMTSSASTTRRKLLLITLGEGQQLYCWKLEEHIRLSLIALVMNRHRIYLTTRIWPVKRKIQYITTSYLHVSPIHQPNWTRRSKAIDILKLDFPVTGLAKQKHFLE